MLGARRTLAGSQRAGSARLRGRGLGSAVHHPPSECRTKADRAYGDHADKEALDPVPNDPRGIAPSWTERARADCPVPDLEHRSPTESTELSTGPKVVPLAARLFIPNKFRPAGPRKCGPFGFLRFARWRPPPATLLGGRRITVGAVSSEARYVPQSVGGSERRARVTCGDWVESSDRYGDDSRSRKRALLALYLAAGRLFSVPSMSGSPSVGLTAQFHFRPRFLSSTLKIGNRPDMVSAPQAATSTHDLHPASITCIRIAKES
jgi:hypothetical protein